MEGTRIAPRSGLSIRNVAELQGKFFASLHRLTGIAPIEIQPGSGVPDVAIGRNSLLHNGHVLDSTSTWPLIQYSAEPGREEGTDVSEARRTTEIGRRGPPGIAPELHESTLHSCSSSRSISIGEKSPIQRKRKALPAAPGPPNHGRPSARHGATGPHGDPVGAHQQGKPTRQRRASSSLE